MDWKVYYTGEAVCWEGIKKVSVEEVPDPKVLNPQDAIVKITSTAICGSDLHIYDAYIPSVLPGDILGHEFMGEARSRVNGCAGEGRTYVE